MFDFDLVRAVNVDVTFFEVSGCIIRAFSVNGVVIVVDDVVDDDVLFDVLLVTVVLFDDALLLLSPLLLLPSIKLS